MSDQPSNQSVRVHVRGLRKSFRGQEVLHGVSLDVDRGEIFVIMGTSGSGKSVLLKHIIGLEEPDSGEVRIEDRPVHGSDVLQQFRVAMVFQSGALLNSLSVAENVGLYLTEHQLKPAEEIARIVADKLAVVGLADEGERMPSELSGGMKKRVALARALVIEPQLILYDEPTSELDPLMAITIGEEILKLKERTCATSIVVTHDRDLAFGIADRMAIIHEGNILKVGRPDEVKADPNPLIQRFLHADFKPKTKV